VVGLVAFVVGVAAVPVELRGSRLSCSTSGLRVSGCRLAHLGGAPGPGDTGSGQCRQAAAMFWASAWALGDLGWEKPRPARGRRGVGFRGEFFHTSTVAQKATAAAFNANGKKSASAAGKLGRGRPRKTQ
jgi:hypothetical protein